MLLGKKCVIYSCHLKILAKTKQKWQQILRIESQSGFHYITVEEIKVKLGEFWMKISVIFTMEEHKIKENVLLLIFNDSISKIKWHNPWRFQKYMSITKFHSIKPTDNINCGLYTIQSYFNRNNYLQRSAALYCDGTNTIQN